VKELDIILCNGASGGVEKTSGHRSQKPVDHIFISKMRRGSFLDIWTKYGTNMFYDHYLLIAVVAIDKQYDM
jgi:endonuclease/exonuclease/phosphatase family metal-dependent hydrolase